MVTDVQLHTQLAIELEAQAAELQARAREHRQKAAFLEEEANLLNLYMVRSYVSGTIEFMVHAPDDESARLIATRWSEVTESAFRMAQDMGEVLDEDGLPERWDITETRVTGVGHVLRTFWPIDG